MPVRGEPGRGQQPAAHFAQLRQAPENPGFLRGERQQPFDIVFGQGLLLVFKQNEEVAQLRGFLGEEVLQGGEGMPLPLTLCALARRSSA